MDENEKLESEVREMFGITDDTEPADNSQDTAADENASTTDDNQETSQKDDNDSAGDTEQAASQDSATETTPKDQNKEKDTTPNPEDKFSKQNSAFAQMRIQNKELSDLIMDLAKATGQNPKNMAEAQTMLKEGLTKVVSKNRNIPEDVLREMEEDKKALAGFQAVKDAHGLTKEEVNSFADKLIERNLNPFEQDLDLVKEYRNIYFEELIAKAKEAGVQEERARNLKAQQNSTTPSAQKGLPENTGSQETPIKSINDLDKLLDSLK